MKSTMFCLTTITRQLRQTLLQFRSQHLERIFGKCALLGALDRPADLRHPQSKLRRQSALPPALIPIDDFPCDEARRGCHFATAIVQPLTSEPSLASSHVRSSGIMDRPMRGLVFAFVLVAVPGTGSAQDDLDRAPSEMTLQVTTDPPPVECRRLEVLNPLSLTFLPLHRTFNEEFDEHPLAGGRWVPHYAGGAKWPEARYWGGDGSDFKRKTSANGEQQIYVDPRYGGRGTTPLGLDPFRVEDGVLSIVARRTPPEFKAVLFDNEFISGLLTTQGTFSQKYGYFEIRAKVPVGHSVWPAFWMLADDGGWPPEIDVLEGRGERPGDLVMTTHWRIHETGKIQSCGFDFAVADAANDFHDYGVLWEKDRLAYFIDRRPVSDIMVPIGFDDPMYMIVNLAIGSKFFLGVGPVDRTTPDTVAFEIDRISVYQIGTGVLE
jgi:Glycosyl hydrolases family 16